MSSTMLPLVAIRPDAAVGLGRRRPGRLPVFLALPLVGLASGGLWVGTLALVRYLISL